MSSIFQIILACIFIFASGVGGTISGFKQKKKLFSRWSGRVFIGICALVLVTGSLMLQGGCQRLQDEKAQMRVKSLSEYKGTFQDLVQLLESQLASEDTKIMVSEAVKDFETGEYRNVPLVLERKEGVHLIKIAVESRASQQPLRVEDIDVVVAKYRALGIPNVVLVSSAGFTTPAYRKAQATNIQLLSFEEAMVAEWSEVVNKLKNIVIDSFVIPYLVGGTIILPHGASLPSEQINYKDYKLIDPNGQVVSTIKEWSEKKIQDKDVIKTLHKKISKSGSYTLSKTIPLPEGFSILSPSNNKILIKAVEIKGKCHKEIKIVSLEKASYGKAQVGFGSDKSMGHEFMFVVSEKEETPAQIGVSIKKIKEE